MASSHSNILSCQELWVEARHNSLRSCSIPRTSTSQSHLYLAPFHASPWDCDLRWPGARCFTLSPYLCILFVDSVFSASKECLKSWHLCRFLLWGNLEAFQRSFSTWKGKGGMEVWKSSMEACTAMHCFPNLPKGWGFSKIVIAFNLLMEDTS